MVASNAPAALVHPGTGTVAAALPHSSLTEPMKRRFQFTSTVLIPQPSCALARQGGIALLLTSIPTVRCDTRPSVSTASYLLTRVACTATEKCPARVGADSQVALMSSPSVVIWARFCKKFFGGFSCPPAPRVNGAQRLGSVPPAA